LDCLSRSTESATPLLHNRGGRVKKLLTGMAVDNQAEGRVLQGRPALAKKHVAMDDYGNPMQLIQVIG
jgi:hypothetical protein